jgi:hypothetical protein
MSMQVPRSVPVSIAVACLAVAAILILTAFAPFSPWSASEFGNIPNHPADQPSAETASATRAPGGIPENTGRCTHCGIVVSTERVAPVGDAPAVYQVKVRLADKTTRVFSETSAPRWRPGERIVIIEGGDSARN